MAEVPDGSTDLIVRDRNARVKALQFRWHVINLISAVSRVALAVSVEALTLGSMPPLTDDEKRCSEGPPARLHQQGLGQLTL
jgi:hypothetical protein